MKNRNQNQAILLLIHEKWISFPCGISEQYSGQWILKRSFLPVQGWLEISGCTNEKLISAEHHFSDLCLHISEKGTFECLEKNRSLPQSNIALSGIRMWFFLSYSTKGENAQSKDTLHFFPEQFKTFFFFFLGQTRYLTKSLPTVSSFTSGYFTISFKVLFGLSVSLLLYSKDGKV